MQPLVSFPTRLRHPFFGSDKCRYVRQRMDGKPIGARRRLSVKDHEFRAEPVSDPSERARIDDVFLEKHGAWERMWLPQDRGETPTHYARLRAH